MPADAAILLRSPPKQAPSREAGLPRRKACRGLPPSWRDGGQSHSPETPLARRGQGAQSTQVGGDLCSELASHPPPHGTVKWGSRDFAPAPRTSMPLRPVPGKALSSARRSSLRGIGSPGGPFPFRTGLSLQPRWDGLPRRGEGGLLFLRGALDPFLPWGASERAKVPRKARFLHSRSGGLSHCLAGLEGRTLAPGSPPPPSPRAIRIWASAFQNLGQLLGSCVAVSRGEKLFKQAARISLPASNLPIW